jgi:hypothetical protein
LLKGWKGSTLGGDALAAHYAHVGARSAITRTAAPGRFSLVSSVHPRLLSEAGFSRSL